METNNIELGDLKTIAKTMTGKNTPEKFMYYVGGVFMKEKGNFYKTLEREIDRRMRAKKDLREESHKSIALIITLTPKEDEGLLNAVTSLAIDEYRQELEDINDLS